MTGRCSQVPRSCLVKWEFLCDRCEEVAYVLRRFSGGLKEEQAGFMRICLSIGRGDCPLVRVLGDEIELVACESDDDIFVCLAL